MAASIIIARIRDALDSGSLKIVPDSFNFKPIETVADLLRPWEEMFPGVNRDADDEDSRSVFSYDGLNRPNLTPVARRSRRPLPPPLPIAASPKSVSPAMFSSIQGIWEYYQACGLADDSLLQLPFDINGMQLYVQPLSDALALMNYYPLFVPLDLLFGDEDPATQKGIHLMLPHWTYEEEGVDVVEAFLSGEEGVQSLLSHHWDDLELCEKDAALVKNAGLDKVISAYASYPGVKSVDLDKLFDWYEVFFDSVKKSHPEKMEEEWPIISGNSGYDADVTITCAKDIQFCIDYFFAYDRMMASMPYPYDFYLNDSGEMETFVHEICEVWRKQNGKRSVRWTSPKKQTLAQVFKEGGK